MKPKRENILRKEKEKNCSLGGWAHHIAASEALFGPLFGQGMVFKDLTESFVHCLHYLARVLCQLPLLPALAVAVPDKYRRAFQKWLTVDERVRARYPVREGHDS